MHVSKHSMEQRIKFRRATKHHLISMSARNFIPVFSSLINDMNKSLAVSVDNFCFLCSGFGSLSIQYIFGVLKATLLSFHCKDKCLAPRELVASWPEEKSFLSLIVFFLIFSAKATDWLVLTSEAKEGFLVGNQRCLVWSNKAQLPPFVLPMGCLLWAALVHTCWDNKTV